MIAMGMGMGMVETMSKRPFIITKQIRKTLLSSRVSPPQKVIAGLAFGLWTQIVPNDIILYRIAAVAVRASSISHVCVFLQMRNSIHGLWMIVFSHHSNVEVFITPYYT